MKKGILIHFGELSTKGKNRKDFIETLYYNVRHAVNPFEGTKTVKDRDHIRVYSEGNLEAILERLLDVSGINRLSLFYECGRSLDDIKEAAVLAYEESGRGTFKIDTDRPDKSFPMKSYEISREVGGYVLSKCEGSKVDVHNPDVKIRVLVSQLGIYVYSKTYQASGGYPLGTLGKAMMLLSGGIDSPVAAYLLLRRGIAIEAIHFAAPPYTSEEAVEKTKDLLRKLNAYQETIRLNVVNFTPLQLKIYEVAGDPYAITIMRRMMLRIAERLAKKRRCLCLATGESVGQVASQTLQSIEAINAVTSFPVLRPLATTDKTSTIEIARKIDTFDISIRPHEDCCTIFTPRHPVTKPKIDRCEEIEKGFDYEALIEECLNSVESFLIGKGN